MDTSPQVLVTGGSGWLASFVLAALLERGVRVRATLRDLGREAEVRARLVGSSERLTFARADLLEDEGWDEALAGIDAVLHLAAPSTSTREVVAVAREGTRRVLEAAARAEVDRVVVTSSCQAALGSDDAPSDERAFTDLGAKGTSEYTRAKTLAEEDAWRFVRETTPSFALTALLPGFLLGPVVDRRWSSSVDLVARILRGAIPALPRVAVNVADARDVAAAHVRALLDPDAAGERFLLTGETLFLHEIASLLRTRFPAWEKRISLKLAPDFSVKVAALFNPSMRSIASSLGKRRTFDSEKARRVLGFENRSADASIVDTAASLLEGDFV